MDVRKEAHASGRGKLAASGIKTIAADLEHSSPTRRDAAIARLRIIGARALPHLSALIASNAPARGRAAALAVLEGSDDRKSSDLALTALRDPDSDVAIAAIGVLRGWLTRESGTQVLEALTTVALERQREAIVRLAALDALSELPADLVAPIRDRAPVDAPDTPPLDEPASLKGWLGERDASAPFSVLHDAIGRVREREHTEPLAARREAWRGCRGALHAALAHRGSRIAVYDLRETFETTSRPLPADFVTAIARVGDDSCLEPMARAWASTKGEPWWRTRLMEAAADIVSRHKMGGRHATLKRIRAKWPGFL